MRKYIIIGGGISGLLAAMSLRKKGIEFIGYNQSNRLGGKILSSLPRLYYQNSVEFLGELFPTLSWEPIEAPPLERHKTNWREINNESYQELDTFLGTKFYSPNFPINTLVQKISNEVGHNFRLCKQVKTVRVSPPKVTFEEGSELEFENLIWCAGIDALLTTLEGSEKHLLIKNLRNAYHPFGGIQLNMELGGPLLPNKNSIVFPFKYKDIDFHTLGISSSPNQSNNNNYEVHWTLFLSRELVDNREEVAKYVKAFKRELKKFFPELENLALNEKITFFFPFSFDRPLKQKNFFVLPNILYLGPQLQLEESPEDISHLDRVFENQKIFSSLI